LRLSDAALGMVLLGAAAAIAAVAQGFPGVPGQNFGPSLFPTAIAGGFVLCALGLFLRHARTGGGARWVDPGPLITDPRARLDALLVLGAVAAYLLVAERLGFIPTAAAILLVLTRRFGASWRLALATAALGPLAIHLMFAEWLRVPLPLGLLAGLRYAL
jgi:putative tricarboxylic transport membrane protein